MARCRPILAALIALTALALPASLAASPLAGTAKPEARAERVGASGSANGAALGIFLGQPTGLTFRYGLGKGHSLEAKAAWNFAKSGDSSICVQANWLLEFPGVLVIQEQDFPLYVGAGVQANLGSTTSLGIRIPGGVIYRFAGAPIELNLELGLGMQLIPSTEFEGSGGLGVRYRF